MEISCGVLRVGVEAFQEGKRRVDVAAADIAGAAATGSPQEPDADINPDLVTSLLELRAGKLQAQAGVQVVETASEILGALLDTRA